MKTKNPKTILVAINAKFIHSSLAVWGLRPFMGDDVHIKEFTLNHREDHIISELFKMEPDVLAFSCYIWNIEMILSIVETFKKIMPDVKIIAGGPEASYDYDYLYAHGVDIVETGEVASLNDTPFPYRHGFDNFKDRIIYYESSRGCANSCGYCLSSADTGVEFLPLSRIISELDVFLSGGVKQVKFVDRTFNSNKKHATAIWEHIINHDNNITNFHFEIAGDLVNEEMLHILKKARSGLIQFEIGVQSTNPQTLSAIDRKTDTDKLLQNVRKLKRLGNIHLHLDLIVGLPYEDLSTFTQSFNDVMACYPNQLQVGFLKLLKGSSLRQNAAKYGIKFKSRPPYEILENDFLDFATINKLKMVEHMVEMFYNSGNFSTYTMYMMRYYPTPYDFFDALATFWEECGYHSRNHKKSTLYTILYEFGRQSNIKGREICELLKYDMLSKENIRTFPAWITDYYQYDHKKVTRTSATHIFLYDIPTWLKDPSQPLQEKEVEVICNFSNI